MCGPPPSGLVLPVLGSLVIQDSCGSSEIATHPEGPPPCLQRILSSYATSRIAPLFPEFDTAVARRGPSRPATDCRCRRPRVRVPAGMRCVGSVTRQVEQRARAGERSGRSAIKAGINMVDIPLLAPNVNNGRIPIEILLSVSKLHVHPGFVHGLSPPGFSSGGPSRRLPHCAGREAGSRSTRTRRSMIKR